MPLIRCSATRCTNVWQGWCQIGVAAARFPSMSPRSSSSSPSWWHRIIVVNPIWFLTCRQPCHYHVERFALKGRVRCATLVLQISETHITLIFKWDPKTSNHWKCRIGWDEALKNLYFEWPVIILLALKDTEPVETTWSADTSQRLGSPHVSAERTRRWFWLFQK